jgi:hypothetical protein
MIFGFLRMQKLCSLIPIAQSNLDQAVAKPVLDLARGGLVGHMYPERVPRRLMRLRSPALEGLRA